MNTKYHLLLLAVSFILFIQTATAMTLQPSAKNTINVVEITNFKCPYCYTAFLEAYRIKQSVISHGGLFDLVPIAWDKLSEWPVRVFLGSKNSDRDDITLILFKLLVVDGLDFDSPYKTCFAISQELLNLSIKDCIEQASTTRVDFRIINTWKLLNSISHKRPLIDLPLFVIEQNNKVIKLLSRSDYNNINQLIRAVLYEIDNNKN